MSEQRLRNLYLPPFKAAIDAGSDTAMCSFNAINGVPGCANKRLETDILKKEWGFDGFIESDYTAVAELRKEVETAKIVRKGDELVVEFKSAILFDTGRAELRAMIEEAW